MKYLTCFLTYLAYSSLHNLRMSYSFNKFYIKRQFLINDFYLGFLDALVYLSLGTGTMVRYSLIRNNSDMTSTYLATSILTALSISMISFLGLVSDQQNITQHHHYFLFKIIITLSLILFGFMQLASRPIVTSLLGAELKAEQHGCLVGAWASHSNAGHISGLMLSNFLVHTLKIKWQESIFIGAIGCISISLLVYFVLENPVQKKTNYQCQKTLPNKSKLKGQKQLHSSHQFYLFIMQMLKSTHYKFYILTYTIVKAMAYTFLLWYPLFLQSVQLKEYSGYITIVFQIASIFGSLFFGKLYSLQTELKNKEQNNLSNFLQKIINAKSFLAMTFIIIIVSIFYISKGSLLIYAVFALSMGFVLGGVANTLGSNEILLFSQNQKKRLDYLTNFNVSFSSFFIGLIQLLVGFALYEKNLNEQQFVFERQTSKSLHSYKVVFLVLLVLAIIVTLLFVCMMFVRKEENLEKSSFQVLVDEE